MIKTDKELKIPNWSKYDINRWADYIELRCLYNDDHLLSKDDVLDLFYDEADDWQRGEMEHSARYDQLATIIGNYFEIISYRTARHNNAYPFNVEDRQCITLMGQLTERHLHYIFLLLCSSICFMDRSSLQKITLLFEQYCHPIMKLLMPPDAQTELFGTARDPGPFSGDLRSRIRQLAELLGAQTTKVLDDDTRYDRIRAGDAGLDIVSVLKLDDTSHIPFALGQCTCSYENWVDKQRSIDQDTWRARIDPIAPFWRFMFVPFFCRNASGRFERPTDIHTCLIDRQRILTILERHPGLYRDLRMLKLKERLQEIW